MLGGGTRAGFLSDALLQLLALPLLLYALWQLSERPATLQIRMTLLFCLALAAVPLIQLVPLPSWLWTLLPHRETAVSTFDLMGKGIPWMPISLSPQATWLSLLSLVPPLSVFIGTALLSYRERRWLSLLLIAMGIISGFLGLLQVAQGPNSALRFFAFTNPAEAVGFFANRNHFAALIYVVMLFVVAWTIPAIDHFGGSQRGTSYLSVVWVLAGFTLMVLLLSVEMMARSRAGLSLTIVSLFGILALIFFAQGSRPFAGSRFGSLKLGGQWLTVTPVKLLLAAIVLAVTFSFQYALYRMRERFGVDPAEDARLIFLPNTIAAAKAFMPFGSGMGTFVSVYPLFEKPQDLLVNLYANRAHNDAAEVWLEAGIVAVVLMGAFFGWLIARSIAVWRNATLAGATRLDYLLARAATIVIGLLLLHSFVDYPLRTAALMVVFAFACALLVDSPGPSQNEAKLAAAVGARQSSGSPNFAPQPYTDKTLSTSRDRRRTSGASEQAPAQASERWGEEISWPDAWSKSPSKGGDDQNAKGSNSSEPEEK